ncbi:MAG: hypothetical protein GYA16_07000 [Spirochaetes bacterium]|nr:hypothetical protein [Spirochaetota bacterium]
MSQKLAWALYAGLAPACIPVAFLAIAKGKAALERNRSVQEVNGKPVSISNSLLRRT